MNDNHNLRDEILVRHLAGEATVQDEQWLHEWRHSSAEHEQYYQHFLQLWTASKRLEYTSAVNTEMAWQNLKKKLSETKEQHKSVQMLPVWKNMIKVAALLLLMLGTGWGYLQFQKRELIMAAEDIVRNETLPDGSTVTLNKNARLYYPHAFVGQVRKVRLEGEAFFHIKPDRQHPFIIEANKVNVKVVGTSFNVKSNLSKTEVIVETGCVEVTKDKQKITLNPKEKAVVDIAQNSLQKSSTQDQLYNYYRSNEFECINIPLWRVVEVLNEAYNAQIVIENPEIKDLKFRTNLINQSLEENLLIIAETLDIEVQKSGATIILK